MRNDDDCIAALQPSQSSSDEVLLLRTCQMLYKKAETIFDLNYNSTPIVASGIWCWIYSSIPLEHTFMLWMTCIGFFCVHCWCHDSVFIIFSLCIAPFSTGISRWCVAPTLPCDTHSPKIESNMIYSDMYMSLLIYLSLIPFSRMICSSWWIPWWANHGLFQIFNEESQGRLHGCFWTPSPFPWERNRIARENKPSWHRQDAII